MPMDSFIRRLCLQLAELACVPDVISTRNQVSENCPTLRSKLQDQYEVLNGHFKIILKPHAYFSFLSKCFY